MRIGLAKILVCMLFVGLIGCGATTPSIQGISGTATVGGKPLPEACVLTFTSVEGNESFNTRTNQGGSYRYVPASALRIMPGTYKVVVAPPGPKTVVVNGMQSPDPGYKPDQKLIPRKYRSMETTPIEINIGERHIKFNVDLEP